MILSPSQLHILQHALGCDHFGETSYRGKDERDGCWQFHRNHYVAVENDDIRTLVAAGFMTMAKIDLGGRTVRLTGFHDVYRVTEAGRDVMIAQSSRRS